MARQHKEQTDQKQPYRKADAVFKVERVFLGEKPANEVYKEWVINNIVQDRRRV